MWKKLLTAALVTSMLILPVNSAAPVYSEEAPAPAQNARLGNVPAQTDAAESMTPAFHGLVLALMNHDAACLDLESRELAWEALYNMLSLYGQLDWRGEPEDGVLLLPTETVADYAAALGIFLEDLGPVPAALQGRISYSASDRVYRVACGEDGLSQIQVDSVEDTADGLVLTGALVYEPDSTKLAQFQATLQIQDSMLGYVVTQFALTD